MLSIRECDDQRIPLVREVDIPVVGVREFRRMRGEYYLTVDDVLGAKNSDDAGGL